MKILYVVNNAAFFCSHRLPIALAARAAGHEVALATGGPGSVSMEAPAVRQLAELGIAHRRLAFTSTGTHPWQELTGLMQLVRHVGQWRPDIVHCASPKGLLYGGIAARLGGARGLVLAVSGMGSMYTPGASMARRLLRAAYGALVRLSYGHPNRRVIVQNRDDRDAVLASGLAGDTEVSTIPGSGVRLAPFVELDIESREPLVVLPARLLRDKGVLEFVEAARHLRRGGVDWRLALVGTADYANPNAISEAEIGAWVREGVIEWWGHRTDMPAVLGQARIVCLPSYREGMPKALLEAAAAGCAVVTTDAIGCREAVWRGVTGDLVPLRDASALARALRRLIDDPARCRAYGLAGRAMARERFDLDTVVRRTLDLYDELMASGRGAGQ